MAQTLLRRASSKTNERLEKFTAALSAETGRDWRTLVQEDLRVEAEAAMGR